MSNINIVVTGSAHPSGNFIIKGGYNPLGVFSGIAYPPLDLVFDKFFPYDNGNGDPIYDTDNGSQLRDPVTGL